MDTGFDVAEQAQDFDTYHLKARINYILGFAIGWCSNDLT